jgi:hypothetical protein
MEVNTEFEKNVEVGVIYSYFKIVSKLSHKGLRKIAKNVYRMSSVIFG